MIEVGNAKRPRDIETLVNFRLSPSVYRRWGNLENLLADVVLACLNERSPMPDTGSLGRRPARLRGQRGPRDHWTRRPDGAAPGRRRLWVARWRRDSRRGPSSMA
ncbi:hypothetical protein [Actinomadura welshii]|uniref:hypothetical protein n=1 Tax=Actinomadura welshii TaxID=3103817 RepID=UPI003B8A96D5